MLPGFFGHTNVTLDSKGRIAIPTKYREPLLAQCAGEMCLTRHPEDYLLLYPMQEWELLVARIMKLPASQSELRTVLVGSAEMVTMDNAGRILIAPALREEIGLGETVDFRGQVHHFRIDKPELRKVQEKKNYAGNKHLLPEDFHL